MLLDLVVVELQISSENMQVEVVLHLLEVATSLPDLLPDKLLVGENNVLIGTVDLKLTLLIIM